MAENDEVIGFHKGALSTLVKERQELTKLVQIVDSLIQMHAKALQDLGIDLTKGEMPAEEKPAKKKNK
jgi:hypothetical protein